MSAWVAEAAEEEAGTAGKVVDGESEGAVRADDAGFVRWGQGGGGAHHDDGGGGGGFGAVAIDGDHGLVDDFADAEVVIGEA